MLCFSITTRHFIDIHRIKTLNHLFLKQNLLNMIIRMNLGIQSGTKNTPQFFQGRI